MGVVTLNDWLNEEGKQIENIISETMFRTRCCIPAIVQSYNSSRNTVECQPAIREKVTLDDVRGSMVSKMEAKNISFELSGMSYLSCPNLKATTLNISLKESAQLVLGNANADEANIVLTDSSSIQASILAAKKCSALLENASIVNVKFVSDDLKIESSGTVSGTIEGSTIAAKIEVSGRSKLNCIALLTTYTEANIMGASSLSIYVSEELKAYVNGDSILSYKGKCKEKIDASGEAIINHVE